MAQHVISTTATLLAQRSGRAIGVLGKLPVAGAVKTRLTPPLDTEQAALLYGAFLRDTLRCALAVPNARVTLVHPPLSDDLPRTSGLPDDVACVEECGEGLASAMIGAFQTLFEQGASSVVLIGSDLPTLPVSHIIEAFTALEQANNSVVLGPAEDGGYYLIGLRSPLPVLFDEIEWSTERVLEQTLERAGRAGVPVTLIAPWYDIDTIDDLRRLESALDPIVGLDAPATRQALLEIELAALPAGYAP